MSISLEQRKEKVLQNFLNCLKEHNISQKQAAERMNINKDYLNRLLCGRCSFSNSSLVLFEEFLQEENYE